MLEDYEGSRAEFMKMLAEHGSPPAYLVRAQRVEQVWQTLLNDCRKRQAELLSMPRTRLAQVAELIGHQWEKLAGYVSAPSQAAYLEQLHAEWKPTLRSLVQPTTSQRKIRAALWDLRSSFLRFNRRWENVIAEVDLGQVNYERSEYNDYYLVEKSAALGSDKLAEMGFERLRERTTEDLFAEIPLLKAVDLL